jgi:hypothetical protein
MKTTGLLTLAGTALVALTEPILAVPRDGGGSRGGFGGGHVAGGFNPGHIGGFAGGGIRAAPALPGSGARFSGGQNIGRLNRAPQQFYYYSGARTSPVTPHASSQRLANRPTSSTAGKFAAVNRQSNYVNSAVGQKRVSAPQASKAGNRQSFMKDHAFARHESNWHRDWDKRRAHFDHGHVFVFVDGFWWGLFPWDYYPYYGYDYGDYPYDYSYGYPDDYGDYPYNEAEYSPSQAYSYYNGYAPSGTNSNGAVSAVQSKLASFGYYHGAIDGILGDETEAALARYQQDEDLSVTGTLTGATLHALGLQ